MSNVALELQSLRNMWRLSTIQSGIKQLPPEITRAMDIPFKNVEWPDHLVVPRERIGTGNNRLGTGGH